MGSNRGRRKEAILSEQDLLRIEKAHPQGLTSAQIIQIFQSRGAKLSESTFRKYVQLGLLPRCKRVGTKGKHKGSHGIYPCVTVRRVNSIKRMMARNFSIAEIQRTFSNFKHKVDAVEGDLEDLFKGFEREIAKPRFDVSRTRALSKEIEQARKSATELIRRIVRLETEISWPEDGARIAGGAPARVPLRKRFSPC